MNTGSHKNQSYKTTARKRQDIPKPLNTRIAHGVKSFAKKSPYAWLPYASFVILFVTYFWMLWHPSGKTFEIFCNLVLVSGVLLVASGAVVGPALRSRLFDIRDFATKPRNDGSGQSSTKPAPLTQSEIAGLFLEASEKAEAGTLTVVIASLALVAHLVFEWAS